jgi:sarcosine oxidase, subunit gamma
MSGLERHSALKDRAPLASGDGAAALKETPFEGKVILRGDRERVASAVSGVLGCELPAQVHETAIGSRSMVQWLGPDEWLIITSPGDEAQLLGDVERALAGQHAQVVDVTDYYTTIELSGSRARDMLMKISTIDFHPRSFRSGMCVCSNFGRTVAYARQTQDDGGPGGPAFDLIVRISMADYLWCLLAEAGFEWGLPRQEPRGKVKLHLPHFE